MKTQTLVSVFVGMIYAFMAQTVLAENPPNIVLIISDDQSWTDYGFMGHEAIQTPNLDKLAKQSATFRRGYVPTALCRPSLTTLITGLYSHQSLVTGNDPAATEQNRRHAAESGNDARELLIANIDKNPTVPRILAEKGYLSFQCGKWWEGSYQRGGFTHGMTRGYPKKGGRHGDDGLKIGRDGMQPVNDFIDTAIESEKPFFIWYAPFLPHTPHNPPQRLFEKYEMQGRPKSIATYFAMCDWFDETCGLLLDRLDEKGIADNTLVIYVTDNGWIQNPDGGGYTIRSKRSPYEGGTRTPIMFRWPNRIKAAERPELCSSIDIVPTILATAGAKIPKRLPGLNLLPNLQQQTPINRDTIFGESFAHDIADIENPEASLLYRWVIRDHSKLLLTYDGRPGKMKYPPKGGEPQLFDLQADPHEKVNLATQQPKLVNELSDLLTDWYPVTERKQGVVAPGEDKPDRSPEKRNEPSVSGLFKEEFIFDKAPFKNCHASTICETSRGLVAAWFGGTKEGNEDVGIWTSYHDGQKWNEPVQVADGVQNDGLRYPCWNPVLYQPPGDAPTLLFFKVGPNPREWWGEMMVSYDRGRTYHDRRRLPEGIVGPVRCKPILLDEGVTLLCGSSTEHDGWRVHFETVRLQDGIPGEPWKRIGPINDATAFNAIQPTFLQHAEGRLQVLCRTKEGVIATSFSTDNGQSWSKLAATDLPNPNSGIEALTLADGRHLLVYNHLSSGDSGWGRRGLLNLAVSNDGVSWKEISVLERENGAEFSYPAIIQSRDGKVHITYTHMRTRIKHLVIDPMHLNSDDNE